MEAAVTNLAEIPVKTGIWYSAEFVEYRMPAFAGISIICFRIK